MSISYPRPHHGSASEYQVHGFPYVTGSTTTEVGTSTPIKVSFPFVTQFIHVTNIGASDLYVGFSENGVTGTVTANRFVVPSSAGSEVSPCIPVKCREVYFLGNGGTTGFTVVAGMTNVKEFPILSGSNGFDGVG